MNTISFKITKTSIKDKIVIDEKVMIQPKNSEGEELNNVEQIVMENVKIIGNGKVHLIGSYIEMYDSTIDTTQGDVVVYDHTDVMGSKIEGGVSLRSSVSVEYECTVGAGSVIKNGALVRESTIGKNVKVMEDAQILNSTIGDEETIKKGVYISGTPSIKTPNPVPDTPSDARMANSIVAPAPIDFTNYSDRVSVFGKRAARIWY